MVRTSKNREGIGVGVFMSWKIEYSLVRTREIGYIEDESLTLLVRRYLKFSSLKNYKYNRVGYFYLHHKGLKAFYSAMHHESHDSKTYYRDNFKKIVGMGIRLYRESN